MWGYVKSLVYADKPQTLDHLEDNIRRVIADIRPQMLEKVIENWTSRLDYIRAIRGSPMPELIFKIKTFVLCTKCKTQQSLSKSHLGLLGTFDEGPSFLSPPGIGFLKGQWAFGTCLTPTD
ncbi:hypothetical protein TNCV_2867701 [Trichonephila clavipes]|nr:hypothetical protein TNCV_2867701 [Trichonephila clavipes]